MADEIALPIRTQNPTSIHAVQAKATLNGHFRLINLATGKYLSAQASSRDHDSRPNVVGKVLDANASFQVCRIRAAPNDGTSNTGLETIAPTDEPVKLVPGSLPDVSITEYIIELSASIDTPGAEYPHRLELSSEVQSGVAHQSTVTIPGPTVLVPLTSLNEETPKVQPLNPSVSAASTSRPVFETGLPKAPDLRAGSGSEVVFSPRGGPKTYYHFLAVTKHSDTNTFDEYYVYNPSTQTFLYQDPSPLAESHSRIRSCNKDLALAENSNASLLSGSESSTPPLSDDHFIWKLQREGFGPTEGEYRIIHSKSLTTLKHRVLPEGAQSAFVTPKVPGNVIIEGVSSSTAPDPLTIDFADAIWSFRRQIITGSASQEQVYNINIHREPDRGFLASSTSPVPDRRTFHLMHVPSTLGSAFKKTGNLPIPPFGKQPLSSSNLHYLIAEESEHGLVFWGLLPTTSTPNTSASRWSLVKAHVHIDDETPLPVDIWKNAILKVLRQDTALFWATYGWLIWRFSPARKSPPDGLYLIRSSQSRTLGPAAGSYLGVASFIPDVTQFKLSSDATFIPSQTNAIVWKVKSTIAANGVIFQTVSNYHTGHVCNVYKDSMSCFRASRASRWQRWHIVQTISSTAEHSEWEWINHVEVDKLVSVVRESQLELRSHLQASTEILGELSSTIKSAWEFIPYTFPRHLVVAGDVDPNNTQPKQPSWFKKDPSCKHGIAVMQDGIYRLLHQVTRNIVAVDTQLGHEARVRMLPIESQNSSNYVDGFWYIKSNRNKQDHTLVESYTITSLSQLPSCLKESEENVGLPFTGIRTTVGDRKSISGIAWHLWRVEQSNWVLQCIDGSGGFLRVGSDGIPASFPLSAGEPSPADMWSFVPYKQEVSAGMYIALHQTKQQYLCYDTRSPSIPSTTNDIRPTGFLAQEGLSTKWIVKPATRYSYYLQHMQTMRYLKQGIAALGEDPASMYTTTEYNSIVQWVIFPDLNGCMVWRSLDAELANDQRQADAWTMSRVETSPRLFDSKFSDMLAPGEYSIQNRATGKYICWDDSGVPGRWLPICQAGSNEAWKMTPTGTGYYTITAKQQFLGMPTLTSSFRSEMPCEAIGGSNLSQWKLVQNNVADYKIVNKETGLALGHSDGFLNPVQMADDGTEIKSCTWKLEMTAVEVDSKDKQRPFVPQERTLADGLYTIEHLRLQTLLTFSQTDRRITPKDPKDLVDSSDLRFQVWDMRQLSNGWYRIKCMTVDRHFANVGLREPEAATIDVENDLDAKGADWRFIQTSKAGATYIVSRASPTLAVGIQSSEIVLSTYDYSEAEGTEFQWTIRPWSESSNKALPEGVYTISRYPTMPTILDKSGPPGAAKAMRALDGRNGVAELSDLDAQRSSQLWFIYPQGLSYIITRFDSRSPLQASKDNTTEPTFNRSWSIVSQPAGGYVLACRVFAVDDPNILGWDDAESTVVRPSTAELEMKFRWHVKRCGFHLQSLAPTLINQVVAAGQNTEDVARLTPFLPSWGTPQSAHDRQSQIWHLVKDIDESNYRLVNQLTGKCLQPVRGVMSTAEAVRAGGPNFAAWKLGKTVSGICLQWQAMPQLFLGVSDRCDGEIILRAGSTYNLALRSGSAIFKQQLTFQDEVANDGTPYQSQVAISVDTKSWQLVPVESTDRDFLDLPRCILACEDFDLEVPDEGNHVWGQGSDAFARMQYKPNSSAQRFRIQVLGKYMQFINEKTRDILKYDGSVYTERSIGKVGGWFDLVDTKWLRPVKQDLEGSSVIEIAPMITNTGDFYRTGKNVRIQVYSSRGQALVLGLDPSGTVIVQDLDMSSNTQLWSIHQWSKGWYIVHVVSRGLLSLTRGMNGVELGQPGIYTDMTLWHLKLDTNARQRDGFYNLTNARFRSHRLNVDSESRNISVSTTDDLYGFKPVRESSWLTLSRRLKVLETFCRSRGPLFFYSQSAPRPCSVDEYLSTRSLGQGPSNTVLKQKVTVSDLPKNAGDYHLMDSGSRPAIMTPTAYVEIKPPTDPIYVNYTDFVVTFFLCPISTSKGGLNSIVLRVNNETNQLDSCYFHDVGSISNLDSNYSSTDEPVVNPLKIHRVDSLNATKLHVYVGDDGVPTPFFPDGTTNADLEDKSKWGLWWDSASSFQITKADMVDGDATGIVDLIPEWAGYSGNWGSYV